MKYLFALSIAFFSFSSSAQTSDAPSPPVRHCDIMPAFGECVDASDVDAYTCSTVAIMNHLSNDITYPTSAKSAGISGTVYVVFVVEIDGSVSEARVMRSFKVSAEGADKAIEDLEIEAVRSISELPTFRPGTQDGSPVRVEYVIPVKYALN
jgi:TonB family protein